MMRSSSDNVVAYAVGAVAAISCVGLALIRPDRFEPELSDVLLVLLIGTCFGQSIFAAIWSALGPGAFTWRTVGSLVWIGGLTVGLYLNRGLGTSFQWTLPRQIGLPLLAFWLVAQISLLTFAKLTALRVVRPVEGSGVFVVRARQFTNRELLLFVTTLAVFLGAARFFLLLIPGYARQVDWREMDIFIWMFIAALVVYPLLFGAMISSLSARGPGWFVFGSLIIVGSEGLLEVYLVSQRIYANDLHELLSLFLYFFCGHVVATGWMVILGLMLRTAGYRLQFARSIVANPGLRSASI